MIEDRRNLINSKQLMVLIISSTAGVGIISLPYLLVQEVGHNGWIAILLSGHNRDKPYIVWQVYRYGSECILFIVFDT